MAFADRAQREDDADAAFLQFRLIRVPHHARIHHCGGSIAVFVAEIVPDKETHFTLQNQTVAPEIGLDLDLSFFVPFFDLPVPVGKIARDSSEYDKNSQTTNPGRASSRERVSPD